MSARFDVSLNEVEAMGKRAARGAGYPWGLAEEAGFAARWLCDQGEDGCAAILAVLEQGFARDLQRHAPNDLSDASAWQGEGALCPLITGAALGDGAWQVSNGPLTLRDLHGPMVLLPFLSALAADMECHITVEVDGVQAQLDGEALVLAAPLPAKAQQMRIAAHAAKIETAIANAPATRAAPTVETWAALNALAMRTYAPATEESRRLGAGAQTLDD